MMKRKSTEKVKQIKKVRFCEDISMAYCCDDLSTVTQSDEDNNKSNDSNHRNINYREKQPHAENNHKEEISSNTESLLSEPQHDGDPGPHDRLNQTYHKLKGQLKEVQMQLSENPRVGRLKLTLFIIALYSRNIELMKPFPKFLMKGYKPDIPRAKLLMSNMPNLNHILSYSRCEFYTNYLAIQFLHWLTVEMITPPMIQVTYDSMFPVFHKINPITHIIKPDIVMKLNTPNTRSAHTKKLVYIAVNTNHVHRLLHYGMESLLDKNQTTICATNNALVNFKIIEKPDQTQMECSDIDYITLIIAELALDRSTEIFHGRLNVHDKSYLVSNPRMLTLKYLLLYRVGTFDVYKKLVQYEKRKVGKEVQKVEEKDLQKFLCLFAIFVFTTLILITLFSPE
ncbi:hypothetical protein M8J76_004397 [Diaphorina citri]|nr:hypothetical protein M8J75_012693 [Diaphorina citri]KAI5749063.1 hypothetical protein M8J76_004397 [Diaphorina citri]